MDGTNVGAGEASHRHCAALCASSPCCTTLSRLSRKVFVSSC
jgi:hypothetical protein